MILIFEMFALLKFKLYLFQAHGRLHEILDQESQ